MTRVRAVSVALGAGFGFLISWGQFIDPDRIRDMLLLRDAYMWAMFVAAVAVAFVGIRLMRRARMRALVTGDPVSWATRMPDRRVVAGAATFGVGWAVSDVCPGPIAAQIGQGTAWSLLLLVGVGLGIELSIRREEGPRPVRERAPGRERPARVATALPASNPD